MSNAAMIHDVGFSVRFMYHGKRVSGIVDSVKVVGDTKRIAPENRGKTMIVVCLDDTSGDYDFFSCKPGAQFRSYYLHKIEEVL